MAPSEVVSSINEGTTKGRSLARRLADVTTRLASIASLSLSLTGWAGAEDVSVGAARINVPTPDGFVALADKAPRLRSMVQRNYQPSATLIEYFLTESDFKDVASGHSSSRKRSLIVSVPTSLLGVEMSEADFDQLADHFRQADEVANESGRLAQNKKSEANHVTHNGAAVEIAKSTPMGIFLDKKDVIGKASEEDVQAGSEVTRRAVATVAIRVRGVVVNLTCSSAIASDVDVAWVRNTCSKWADVILKLN